MISFNLKKFFFLMAASALYSCQEHHRMEMGALLTKEKNESASSTKYEKLKPPLPKFIAVLLHITGRNPAQTDKMKKALEKNFREDVMVIQIKCIEEFEKIDLKIEDNKFEFLTEFYKEMLYTSTDRLELKSSTNCKECLNDLPMYIFIYDQSNSVADMPEAIHRFYFNLSPKIQTISVCCGDESIKDCIDFLEEQQIYNGCR